VPGFLSSSIWRSGTTAGLSATGVMHAIITRDLAANNKSWLIIPCHQVPECRHIPLRCDTTSAPSKRLLMHPADRPLRHEGVCLRDVVTIWMKDHWHSVVDA
jgi:hypothetical protein